MLCAEVITLVERALKNLRYGSVQLVVHEGKLVRIERLDRIRLSSDSDDVSPTGQPGGSS